MAVNQLAARFGPKSQGSVVRYRFMTGVVPWKSHNRGDLHRNSAFRTEDHVPFERGVPLLVVDAELERWIILSDQSSIRSKARPAAFIPGPNDRRTSTEEPAAHRCSLC